MSAGPERDVAVRVPSDVEYERFRERLLVVVRGGDPHHDGIPGLDPSAAHLDVRGRVAHEVGDRRCPPQGFLHPTADQFRMSYPVIEGRGADQMVEGEARSVRRG